MQENDAIGAVRSNSPMFVHDSTYGQLVLAAVSAYPERVAFRDGERSISYEQLGRSIRRIATLLKAHEFRKGDAVAILAPNMPEYFMVMAACAVLGIRYTPLNLLGSLDDHLSILCDAEIDALIFDPGACGERVQRILESGRFDGTV